VIDNHIHTGQFYGVYYDPADILSIVFDAGVEELFFSSTTGCGEQVKYAEVEAEINRALKGTSSAHAKPLFWAVPDYTKKGLSVTSAMNGLPYTGIKIHPRANVWDMADMLTLSLAHELFDYADRHGMPVLIHTGYDKLDETNKFSGFFGEYRNARFILAHGRPLDQTLRLMRCFANVYCDTAFMPEKDLRRIVDKGLGVKVLPGSDFPITHYFKNKYPEQNGCENISLAEQYTEDMVRLRNYTALTSRICSYPENKYDRISS
jgi:hypothetical protein